MFFLVFQTWDKLVFQKVLQFLNIFPLQVFSCRSWGYNSLWSAQPGHSTLRLWEKALAALLPCINYNADCWYVTLLVHTSHWYVILLVNSGTLHYIASATVAHLSGFHEFKKKAKSSTNKQMNVKGKCFTTNWLNNSGFIIFSKHILVFIFKDYWWKCMWLDLIDEVGISDFRFYKLDL